MRQNIKNKFHQRLDSKLYNEKYYDFMLYAGETSKQSSIEIENMAIADFSSLNVIDDALYSDVVWSASTNTGVDLKDIGMTGVDNGFIKFDKTTISNKEFLDLFFHSEYKIESGDTRLFMKPICGNTQVFSYPMSIVEDNDTKYLSLKGGFYQGFFKLYGFDYQVLPSNINNDLILHFDLRPRSDYETQDNIVNAIHPENSGTFFFMGTRAENKFWNLYNGDNEEFAKDEPIADDYFSPEESAYLQEICDSLYDDQFDSEYFTDGYAEDEKIKDISEYTDSNGTSLNGTAETEIITDNKFVFFNQTETGKTIDNWIDGTLIKIKMRKKYDNINLFPLMNHTETGYTIDNINEFYTKPEKEGGAKKEYNVSKDIQNNVFALKVNEDGSIGYKYGILNCDADNHFEVIEEYSKPGIVKTDEWNSINVRFAILNPSFDKCDKRDRIMRIMIYVNGYLVFISKELKTLNFKELNDTYQKQEGIPYNISLGGGSIGLLETIMPRYYDISKYILPIEKDFCGTFIGDIKSFKIYLGFIDYYSIKNYLS